MRSPFTPNTLGGPGTYIPTDGTLLWDNIVDTLNARTGLDLSAIPAPTAADVSTNVLLVDVSGNAIPIDTVLDIPALRPAITNGIELGYRTVLAERFVVGVDLYYERKNDFIGPLRVETPSAFLDSASLADYLGIYLPIDTARLVANLASQLPIGTVSPVEARDPWDLIVTYRNFGDIDLWGADLEVGMFVTQELLVSGTYSWVNDNVFTDPSGLVVPLNAPKHKGSVRITFRSERLGFFAEARGRAVQGFPVNSGVYIGDVDSYAVFDAQLGYRLPWARNITVTVSGQNIFDHRHAEFIGTPNIGRLVMARVRTEF
jgi:iron complex outermembrane receptor protein